MDIDKIKQSTEDEKEQEELIKNIKKYKYIGETSRSIFERGWEHKLGVKYMNTGSYMLRHAVDMHPGKEFDTSRYRVKILEYARSSFERQIRESVHLQNNREHHLLNSKSEYNRCAIPRLTTVLGEKEHRQERKEEDDDKRKEDTVVGKIRQLKKQHSKTRRQKDTDIRDAFSKKRRMEEPESWEEKIENLLEALEDKDGKEEKKETPGEENIEEERKEDEKKETKVDQEPEQDEEWLEKLKEEEKKLVETLEREGKLEEWIIWEDKLEKYNKDLENEAKEREKRIERATKQHLSWELSRLCAKFLKENAKFWKEREDRVKEERKRDERLETARRKKEENREKEKQKKLMRTWLRLPQKEKEKYREKEEREKRMELKEMKENLWRWKAREGNINLPTKKEDEKRIEEMEEILARLKEEELRRKHEREKELAERRRIQEKIRTDKEKEEEERRREKVRRKERFEKQKMLQSRWEALRWVSQYIDENKVQWELGRLERQEERKRIQEEWDKAARFQKIEILRERDRKKRERKRRIEEGEEKAENTTWTWTEWRKERKQAECGKVEPEVEWPTDYIDFNFTLTNPKLIVDEQGEHWPDVEEDFWPAEPGSSTLEKSKMPECGPAELSQQQPDHPDELNSPEDGPAEVNQEKQNAKNKPNLPECGSTKP